MKPHRLRITGTSEHCIVNVDGIYNLENQFNCWINSETATTFGYVDGCWSLCLGQMKLFDFVHNKKMKKTTDKYLDKYFVGDWFVSGCDSVVYLKITEEYSRKRKVSKDYVDTRVEAYASCVYSNSTHFWFPSGKRPYRRRSSNQKPNLKCGHCDEEFYAKATFRAKFNHYLVNHNCCYMGQTQFVIGRKHKRCIFDCDKKVGCIRFTR